MSRLLKRFVSFAFAAADLLIEVGASGQISFAMGAAQSLTNRREDTLVGKNWLELFDAADHKPVQAMMAGLGPQGRCGPLTVRMATPKGSPERHAALSACRIAGQDEWLSCVLTTLPGEGEEERPLTTNLDDFVKATQAASEAGGGLTFLDAPGLVGLAQSNPAMCQTLVQRISVLLQSSSAGRNAAARLSETRFGIAHDGDGLSLRKGLADITEEGARIGIDLGISAHHVDLGAGALDQDEVLQAVRFAVNRFAAQGSKAKLPESVSQTFEQMVSSALQRMSEFATVVREEKFDLSFQPIVELANGSLHHFEVLARFADGASPFEKVQFAEEIGVIEKFDFAVCTRAVSTMRSASCDGAFQPLRLAVNLSGRSLDNALFIRLLLALLDENRDLAGKLSLEITESARLQDLVRAEKVIQEIRQRGFAVYLDDFGAGAASIEYLQALTVNGVKIDGSYIKRIGASRRDDVLLRGLVRLCGDLGVETVGEMVETTDQGDFLRNAGVTLAQGWLFGKPAPVPEWTSRTAASSTPPRVRGRRQGAVESWG
jgi:EAL domain-containing protein (putative c-di-GMP-specific phosphodiesterase class I)